MLKKVPGKKCLWFTGSQSVMSPQLPRFDSGGSHSTCGHTTCGGNQYRTSGVWGIRPAHLVMEVGGILRFQANGFSIIRQGIPVAAQLEGRVATVEEHLEMTRRFKIHPGEHSKSEWYILNN